MPIYGRWTRFIWYTVTRSWPLTPERSVAVQVSGRLSRPRERVPRIDLRDEEHPVVVDVRRAPAPGAECVVEPADAEIHPAAARLAARNPDHRST